MARTMKELAKEAIQVQDACNLSGVAQAFARAMLDLRAHVNGTDECNTHPISKLWADKIAHLTGTQQYDGLGIVEAYNAVHKLAEE